MDVARMGEDSAAHLHLPAWSSSGILSCSVSPPPHPNLWDVVRMDEECAGLPHLPARNSSGIRDRSESLRLKDEVCHPGSFKSITMPDMSSGPEQNVCIEQTWISPISDLPLFQAHPRVFQFVNRRSQNFFWPWLAASTDENKISLR